jgi:hypothetical protein
MKKMHNAYQDSSRDTAMINFTGNDKRKSGTPAHAHIGMSISNVEGALEYFTL